ncbi:MAG: ATP-grasp domain-containing protein [Dehalococcoidia bacterium]|nr:ATP-grasp domain-containing protein [Dehalococcoidia bacterium]MDD5648625.1 ATP-grasp domain-containing protein [Dehalococcoidia bacterium]
MPLKIAIIYNDPPCEIIIPNGEDEAITGVLEEVVAVKNALISRGHEVEKVPLRLPLDSVPHVLRNIQADVIFNLFEGFEDQPHTEPVVARMMEDMGLSFTGNPSSVLDLTLDKAAFKNVLLDAGIDTPDFMVLTPANIRDFRLRFPCIVKPRDEDASHGLSPENIVSNMEQLKEQVVRISSRFRGSALVEEFIDGREFNASILGNSVHELIEISEIVYTLPPGLPRILTFDSKWFEETDYYINTAVSCPAEVDGDLRERITETVLSSCRTAGCRGYARVDMRQDVDGSIKVLEVNANPDITPELGIALQADVRGMTYADLMQKIVDLALE